MGQLEPNLDLLIAILVHKEPVGIEVDAQRSNHLYLLLLLGTIKLGQVLEEKGLRRSSGAETSQGTT